MKPIRTERLILRNWEDQDADLFYRINSDDRVMEFFPFRRNRMRSDALLKRLRDDIAANGFGFAAMELAATGECIGFTGLHAAEIESFVPPGSMEIGWRMAPAYWGHGYVAEAARAWLEFGFIDKQFEEIISFAVWNNHRSTAVMERIGMVRDPSSDFDHPGVPDTHPDLKRHVFYRLTREEWEKRAR